MSELLTVRDVAAILQIGEDSVIRRFAKMDGVIDLGKSTLGTRRYRVLRIPKTVVERYLISKSKMGKHSIQIEVPERAERRRKSANWEARAIRNLAKASLQNECKDRQTYERIANRARLLVVHVPENRWAEIEWFEDE
jgi:hypothetical protein